MQLQFHRLTCRTAMEAPLEGRLQLVPCDPAAPFLARALLPALHHAVQRQRGLLLLHLPPDVVESTGLAALRDRYSGAPASVGRFRSDQEVQPSAEPAAAAALHTLAGELTKAHMLRMGRRSTALEPFQDDLKQGGAEQHSKQVAFWGACCLGVLSTLPLNSVRRPDAAADDLAFHTRGARHHRPAALLGLLHTHCNLPAAAPALPGSWCPRPPGWTATWTAACSTLWWGGTSISAPSSSTCQARARPVAGDGGGWIIP